MCSMRQLWCSRRTFCHHASMSLLTNLLGKKPNSLREEVKTRSVSSSHMSNSASHSSHHNARVIHMLRCEIWPFWCNFGLFEHLHFRLKCLEGVILDQGNHQNFDPTLIPKKLWPIFMGRKQKKIFFEKKCFASSPWKLVKVSWVLRMGRNFDDYPGFQPKIPPPNISAGSVPPQLLLIEANLYCQNHNESRLR